MELSQQELDFHVKFAVDNVRDGVGDDTLILWPALDVEENREVWILGRRVKDKVLPLARILAPSVEAVKRYAPARSGTANNRQYDFSQAARSPIIRP